MKISNRDKKILIVVIGLVAAVLSYFLVLKPTLEKNQVLENENLELNVRLTDLKEKVAKEDEYRSETERMNREVEQVLAEFPSYLQIENGIMDVVELEERTGASVPSVTIGDYVLVDVVPASTDTEGTEVAASAASQYSLYDINTNMSYSATYSGMKDIIDLIVSDKDKRSVSTFSATFDNSTGELSGSVSYESYFIFGQEKDYQPADIPSIKHGTDNIFGAVDYEIEQVTEEESEDEE